MPSRREDPSPIQTTTSPKKQEDARAQGFGTVSSADDEAAKKTEHTT